MLSFTGAHITREFGAPSIRDMSVSSMRIVRFCGAHEKHFWPVGMHSLLVADISNWFFNEDLEHHMLLHDIASECSMNDIPRPMKTGEQKTLEETLARRTYRSLGLSYPTKKQRELIHEYDLMACNAEGCMGCGPRGYILTQPNFSFRQYAKQRLEFYLDGQEESRWADMFNPDGKWPITLENRLRVAIARTSQKSNSQYTKAA